MEKITPVVQAENAPLFVQWSPIVLGALAATALSSVLLTFAVTIGLGVTSTAPTWRDTSAALAILSGLYLIIQAVLSFGLGGYIAGRIRASIGTATPEEAEQADGVHGLGVWALAVVMGAALAALIGAASLNRIPSMRGPAQASTAEPLLSYELDRLFRAILGEDHGARSGQSTSGGGTDDDVMSSRPTDPSSVLTRPPAD